MVSDNRVTDEDGLLVLQQTSNTPATGQVNVTPTSGLQVGYKLTASARNVQDVDGTQSLYNHLTIYTWRWYRIDPATLEVWPRSGGFSRVSGYTWGRHA